MKHLCSQVKRVLHIAAAIGIVSGCGATTDATASSPAPVKHVFIIVLENENGSTTFGAHSSAPFLAQTLTGMGAYLPNYYGIGHHSLDNYIAMISGQPPNRKTQADCSYFTDFNTKSSGGEPGIPAGSGCVYPTSVQTLASQLDTAGFNWKGYMEDMGNDPSRESATCGHPKIGAKDNTQSAEAKDQYATRHDPFVYFHSVIDNQTYCDQHVVNLTALGTDLQRIATTPNFVFITPNLCNDGHDTNCKNGDAGGLPQADAFLQQWVPQILQSPAYQSDGLLIVMFDEAENDNSACCNEPTGPNTKKPGRSGPGGGKTGAVLLSPFIRPGTVSNTAYNHYSLLNSIESTFGLGYLGYAGQAGLQGFGSDVYTNP